MAPGQLLYEDATVYAQPAFRVMAIIDLPFADGRMRQAMLAILDHFIAAAGDRIALSAYAGGKVKTLRPDPFASKTVEKARKLMMGEAWSWPTTLRFNGYFEDPHGSVAPPHLRFEQTARAAIIQIELPPEDGGLVAFADQMTAVLAGLPVVWGAMGFGLYQPVSLDSLIWMLPRITPRYRCALEVQPSQVEPGLQRIESYALYTKYPALKGGIGDIGWRSLIGQRFLDRLPTLTDDAKAQPAVTLRQFDHFAELTAGPTPVWGDVNTAEDISAWRAVLQMLQAVLPEWEFVRDRLFGGNENDNALDRLEAWYDRLKA